jgi:type IV secretion system protein VirB9
MNRAPRPLLSRGPFANALAALAGALLAAAPAAAEDPRLVDRLYDPDEVVRVEGRANVQTTIRFAENERIENVAIGDSTSWQVTPNKRANLLFVKPLAARAATNMTVVTDKRTYLFDLVANPAHRNPLYVLAFDYPIELETVEEVQQAATGGGAPAGAQVEVAAASDPFAVIDPAALNFAWAGEGNRALLPERVFDDGEATFLAWPLDSALPAILVKDEEGTEGPVNFAVRGDVIVVDGVPREIILRSGEEAATLTNEGPARPAQPNPSALAQAPAPMPVQAPRATQAEAE